MSTLDESVLGNLGPKKAISELGHMLDEKFEKHLLLSFDELSIYLTSKQQKCIERLLELKPTDFERSMPYYGIDEPDPKNNFKILTDTIKNTDTGKPITKSRAIPNHIYSAFLKLNNSIKSDHHNGLEIVSAYRSPARQALLTFYYLDLFDFDASRVFSRVALPGYSEHGLVEETALDLDYTLEHPKDYDDLLFANRPEYDWLEKHARKFGFTLSYPPNNKYNLSFEPWHWRYVGK